MEPRAHGILGDPQYILFLLNMNIKCTKGQSLAGEHSAALICHNLFDWQLIHIDSKLSRTVLYSIRAPH